MRAKRDTTGAQPRLEPLEQRLVPAATLEPAADNPELYTLRIDLSQHPRGGDGAPDTLYVTRAGGVIDVTLVGRQPEVIFRGESAQITGVELRGSSDVEYVLVQDVFDPPLTFLQSDGDRLVQIGEAIVVPDEMIDEPEVAPGGGPTVPYRGDTPTPSVAPPVVADNADLIFTDGVFFFPARETLAPPAEGRADDEEEQPSVPPELLGGKPTEDEVDIRKLEGGSHQEGGFLAGDVVTALPEEEEPPADPPAVAA